MGDFNLAVSKRLAKFNLGFFLRSSDEWLRLQLYFSGQKDNPGKKTPLNYVMVPTFQFDDFDMELLTGLDEDGWLSIINEMIEFYEEDGYQDVRLFDSGFIYHDARGHEEWLFVAARHCPYNYYLMEGDVERSNDTLFGCILRQLNTPNYEDVDDGVYGVYFQESLSPASLYDKYAEYEERYGL